MLKSLIASLLFSALSMVSFSHAEDIVFASADPATDRLVEACFDQDGVDFLPGTDVICYNAAIFPEQYLKLNDLGPASQIIITSPGGNVATARGMTRILDERAEPVTIAGPCMSACAMIILPALENARIHRTTLIAVHGIVMMPFERWHGWLENDEKPQLMDKIAVRSGVNLRFSMHASLTGHMRGHLEAQNVDIDFINVISDQMEEDARAFTNCRVRPEHYWGILSPDYLVRYLSHANLKMEKFVSHWDDPKNKGYQGFGEAIAPQTFILEGAYDQGRCGGEEG